MLTCSLPAAFPQPTRSWVDRWRAFQKPNFPLAFLHFLVMEALKTPAPCKFSQRPHVEPKKVVKKPTRKLHFLVMTSKKHNFSSAGARFSLFRVDFDRNHRANSLSEFWPPLARLSLQILLLARAWAQFSPQLGQTTPENCQKLLWIFWGEFDERCAQLFGNFALARE